MASKYGLLVKNSINAESDQFREMVSINAYFRAEKRGFEPGWEIKDWHEAELEIARYFRHVISTQNQQVNLA